MPHVDEHAVEPRRDQFLQPGSLAEPGPWGRLFRLLMGLWSLWFVVVALTDGLGDLMGPDVPQPDWLIGVAVAVWVAPDVVNIGWSRHFGSKPRWVGIVALGLGFVADLVIYGRVWAPPVGWVLMIWLTYVFAHLGVSFLLAAVTATPGCEMRAVPHLVASMTGNVSHDHACPGPVHIVDQWEQRRTRSSE